MTDLNAGEGTQEPVPPGASQAGGLSSSGNEFNALRTRRTFVSGLEIVASVGVYRHEQHYEQRIVISIELEIADRYDGCSDKLADVYDYQDAIRAARLTAASRHFNLIETLAERICEVCLENHDVRSVTVRIEKPDAVDYCRAVGIEITRRR